jgi:hypothetical protein
MMKAEAFKQMDCKLNFSFRKRPWGPKSDPVWGPKAKGAFIHGLVGTSTRDSKASKIGCYCTRFTCNFPSCIYALRSPNIYIYSKLVFPVGVFPGSC